MLTSEHAGKMAFWIGDPFSVGSHFNGLNVCEPWFLNNICFVLFSPLKPTCVLELVEYSEIQSRGRDWGDWG